MSEFSSGNSNGPIGSGAVVAAAGRARRPASVQLRDASADGDDASLDPATKSLADAMKITYRLVQVAMVGLVGLYALSGFQSVQEGEEGIRLTLGAATATKLPPGFQMSLPAPLGELVRVQTSPQQMAMKTEFWPGVPPSMIDKPASELKSMAQGKVDPERDGSVMTADGNIGHVKVSMTYVRRDANEWAEHILDAATDPNSERNIVTAAVKRGIVIASSTMSIDELMKDLPDEGRPGQFVGLASRARVLAQQSLDAMKSGIEIGEFTITDKTPPLSTLDAFSRVQSAQSDAKRATEAAETERQGTLAATAGDAAPVLLDLIDRYDSQLAKGDVENGEKTLTAIDDLMEGREISIDGTKVTATTSGKVAALLSSASQYRSSVVSRAAADATLFDAKLAAYRSNPAVVVTGDWADAYSKFLKADNVEFTWLPPGTSITELLITGDPSLRRAREVQDLRKAAAAQAAMDVKAEQDTKFKDKGIPTTAKQ